MRALFGIVAGGESQVATVEVQDFVDAMGKFHNLSKEERAALGAAGREHVLKNYNFECGIFCGEKL